MPGTKEQVALCSVQMLKKRFEARKVMLDELEEDMKAEIAAGKDKVKEERAGDAVRYVRWSRIECHNNLVLIYNWCSTAGPSSSRKRGREGEDEDGNRATKIARYGGVSERLHDGPR